MFAHSLRRFDFSVSSGRKFASIVRSHNNKNSNAPLLEKYRPVWPDADFGKGKVAELPPRAIPDKHLNFGLTASFESGSALFYPHLQHNPADFKVKLTVSIDSLELSKDEAEVLIRMVGTRYNVGKREIKLTSDRFPNRIENKRYLTLMLENLVREAKSLNSNKASLSS